MVLEKLYDEVSLFLTKDFEMFINMQQMNNKIVYILIHRWKRAHAKRPGVLFH